MVGGLLQLQQRLQEAENLIQKLEDQLQTLIDEENTPEKGHESETKARYGRTAEPRETTESLQSELSGSYGARYANVPSYGAYGATGAITGGIDTFARSSIAEETRDASFCIGREGTFSAYTRPV